MEIIACFFSLGPNSSAGTMTWIVGGGQQLELEVCGRPGGRAACGGGRAAGRRAGSRRPLSARLAVAPQPDPGTCRRAGAATHVPRPPRARRAPSTSALLDHHLYHTRLRVSRLPECKYLWMSVSSCLDWLWILRYVSNVWCFDFCTTLL